MSEELEPKTEVTEESEVVTPEKKKKRVRLKKSLSGFYLESLLQSLGWSLQVLSMRKSTKKTITIKS